jgi:hypothetical protein
MVMTRMMMLMVTSMVMVAVSAGDCAQERPVHRRTRGAEATRHGTLGEDDQSEGRGKGRDRAAQAGRYAVFIRISTLPMLSPH